MVGAVSHSAPRRTDAARTRVRWRCVTREEFFRRTETGVLGPEDCPELLGGYFVERTAQNAPHCAVIVKGTKLFVDLLRGTTTPSSGADADPIAQ